MSYDRTVRKTTTRSTRRPNYLPPPPPSGSNGHSSLGYWIPLVAIGTLAVGGLAAWVWSERAENDDDDNYDYASEKPPRPPPTGGPYPPSYTTEPTGILPHQRPDFVPPPAPVTQQGGEQYGAAGAAASYYAESSSESRNVEQSNDATFFTRVSGAIRRTPSPQQFFDTASRQVAAAGAAAGAALSSIMEVDSSGDRADRAGREDGERDGFSDHERWSEEAEELQKSDTGRGKDKGRPKRTVAVVLSAESSYAQDEDDDSFHADHGVSISSALPLSSTVLTVHSPSSPTSPPNTTPQQQRSTSSSTLLLSNPSPIPHPTPPVL